MAAQVNEEQNKTKNMTIFVTVPKPRNSLRASDGLKVVSLEVSRDDTVASVKATLHDMERIPPCRQRLVFACSALPDDDDTTLGDHGVIDSATIQLVETQMHVFVRDWSGTMVISGVESCDTVESFRVRLQEKQGLRPKQQRITWGSGQLEDGHTLAEQGVTNYIMMTLHPRTIRMRHRVVELEIEVTDTVGRIKERVEEVEGVPVACQSVSYYAKDLDDDHALVLDGRALEWVTIMCQRHENVDTTKTTNKGDAQSAKRHADLDVNGPRKKTKKRKNIKQKPLVEREAAEIHTVQRRRFCAILDGPELEKICPSSCDMDPAG